MDAFYPFIRRPLLPGQPRSKLITPVGKYTRMLPIQPDGPNHQQRPVSQLAEPIQPPASAEDTTAQEPQLLQTSHRETPLAEQHADAQGHLDLYI